MLEAGALDDVQYALGYHVMPKDMARSGQIIAQINWTACTLMEGEIRGLAAHGSQPHLGVNAIDAGCRHRQCHQRAAQQSRFWAAVSKLPALWAGAGSLNAICDKVSIGFDLRSTSNAEMLELRRKVEEIVSKIRRMCHGAEADCHIVGTCPAAEADPSLLALTQEVISAELGAGGLFLLPILR